MVEENSLPDEMAHLHDSHHAGLYDASHQLDRDRRRSTVSDAMAVCVDRSSTGMAQSWLLHCQVNTACIPVTGAHAVHLRSSFHMHCRLPVVGLYALMFIRVWKNVLKVL